MKMTTKLFLLGLAILLGAFACSASASRALPAEADIGKSEGLKPPPPLPLPPKKWHCQCFDKSRRPIVAATEHDAVDMGLTPDLNITLTGKEWEQKLPWSKWIPKCWCKPFQLIGPPDVGNGNGKGPVVVPAPVDLAGIDIVIAVPNSPPEKEATGN